jgi:hypothetical protein
VGLPHISGSSALLVNGNVVCSCRVMNATTYQVLAGLVEQLPGLSLEQVAPTQHGITLTLTAGAPTATCPLCGTPSASVHSSYLRHPVDLPWADAAVQLRLSVRKFFCREPNCPRRIFTERQAGFLAPHARRTIRLERVLAAIALALGAQAGSRLSKCLAMATSATSLLRLISKTSDKPLV